MQMSGSGNGASEEWVLVVRRTSSPPTRCTCHPILASERDADLCHVHPERTVLLLDASEPVHSDPSQVLNESAMTRICPVMLGPIGEAPRRIPNRTAIARRTG